MQISIKETGVLSFALEVDASAEDLQPDMNRAFRKHRAQLQLKGFRPGHVPLGMVKRLYGKDLADEAVQELLKEAFQDLVVDSGKYEVWEGSPRLDYDYDYEGDLHARVPFAVCPKIDIQDLEGQEIEVPSDKVTDGDIEQAVNDILWNYGEIRPVAEDDALIDGDMVTYDLQEIDSRLHVPVLGTLVTAEVLDLSQEKNALETALREVVIGAKVGERVRFEVRVDSSSAVEEMAKQRSYEAQLTRAERFEPAELADELVQRVTADEEVSVETFRAWVADVFGHKLARKNWEIRQDRMVDRLLEMHKFDAPDVVVQEFVDRMVARAVQHSITSGEALGSEEALRAKLRPMVENRTRWFSLRKALVAHFKLDITEEDIEQDLFSRAYGDVMNSMYRNQAASEVQEEDRYDSLAITYRIENQKLFEALSEKFNVVQSASDESPAAEPEVAAAADE